MDRKYWLTPEKIRTFIHTLWECKPFRVRMKDWHLFECEFYNEAVSSIDPHYDEAAIIVGSKKWMDYLQTLHRRGWSPLKVRAALGVMLGHEIAPEGSLTLSSGFLEGALEVLQIPSGSLTECQ
jgi:hypothetical protein